MRDLVAECDAVECSYAYPSILQDANDGSLWVTYTHDRRTIGWLHFNEAWLSQGTQVARIRCGAFETCVDGACFKGCTSAAECAADEQCIGGACRRPCDEGASCNDGVCRHPSAARCEP